MTLLSQLRALAKGEPIAEVPVGPKLYRVRDIVEAVRKNCGTGAGGFQEGNSCASGTGTGEGAVDRASLVARYYSNYKSYEKLIQDATTGMARTTNYRMELVDISTVKPTEDSDNASSKALAVKLKEANKLQRKKDPGEYEIEDFVSNRAADFNPILLDNKRNILDGNHRYAAHVMNNEKKILAFVPSGKGTGKVVNIKEFYLAHGGLQKNCGTGAGGFQEGNTCGSGGGSLQPVKLDNRNAKIVRDYQDNSHEINGHLREGPVGYAPEKVQREVIKMDNIMESKGVKIPKGTVLYRGLDLAELSMRDGEDGAYLSTTTDKDSAGFFGDTVLEIKLEDDILGLPILSGKESEVILARRTHFKLGSKVGEIERRGEKVAVYSASVGRGASKLAKASGPISRDSCLDCVEKHLGAAMVLLGEVRDGYEYRLRIIGHLHEAEDESQEYNALHDAIREARKAWQEDGTVPDWEKLCGMAEKLQKSEKTDGENCGTGAGGFQEGNTCGGRAAGEGATRTIGPKNLGDAKGYGGVKADKIAAVHEFNPEDTDGLKAIVVRNDGEKPKYLYTDEYHERKSTAKFAKAQRFAGKIGDLRSDVAKSLRSDNEKERDTASIVALIDETYMRVGGGGSEGETGSVGATTLRV